MHGDTHDVGAPARDRLEVGFLPVAVPLQLIWIGDVNPLEDDGRAAFVYETITLHTNDGKLSVQLTCIEDARVRDVPPAAVL